MRSSRKIFIALLFVVLIGCGYTPIYKDFKNINFSIILQDSSGNRNINNLIKAKLSNYKSTDVTKIYNINFDSNYSKSIVAKDTTGAATEYKLNIKINFTVESDNYKKKISI